MDNLTQKRITDNGEGKGYFRNCIDYVYKEKLEPGEALIATKGYGVCDTNPDYTYEEMKYVKEYYGKNGDNPVMHMVLSYDKKTCMDEETACRYTDRAAAYFKDDYQTITAVHKEDQGNSLYHAHIVINSVNSNNGKLYHSGRSELTSFAVHVHEVTGTYCKPRLKKPGEQ